MFRISRGESGLDADTLDDDRERQRSERPGRFDVSRFKLSGADLSGFNVTNADLRGADLSTACLGSADLTNAALGGAKLVDTDLGSAHLSDTDPRARAGITFLFLATDETRIEHG
jgi:uncharacterized protein YjbI with pentapeptide repeats